jgi:hypothetical protein
MNHLYLSNEILKRPNHRRITRLMREMQCPFRQDRRQQYVLFLLDDDRRVAVSGRTLSFSG